jgi:photosystem II stability/assembly factor-like uncharacterized protein
MRLKFTLLFFMLSSALCDAQYKWQALPGAPTSWRFDDFCFINPSVGWAINPNYENATPSQTGRIFRTIDGGKTWEKLLDGANTFFRSIGFADSLTGWIGNLADTALDTYFHTRATSDTVPLYQTIDGGLSWTAANLPNPHPAGICGISVVNDSVVFAYGRFMSPAGYVKTTNKGASWTNKDMSSLAFGLVDGRFFNQDTGFITGMGTDMKAIILSTVDGGATWNYCYHSVRSDSDRVWKIFFSSRNIGYASIEYGGSADRTASPYNTFFLKTTNGGKSWTEHPFISNYDEEGMGFINDSVGWIGGSTYMGTYKTEDGGNTWGNDETFGIVTPPYVISKTGFSANRFRSFGDILMYASGNTIYKLQPLFTGIKELQNVSEPMSNYPNPFATQTTINYTIPIPSDNVMLVVSNVLGQSVFSKSLGSQNAGLHQLIFNEELTAGMYYYTIGNDRFRSIQKMVIAR